MTKPETLILRGLALAFAGAGAVCLVDAVELWIAWRWWWYYEVRSAALIVLAAGLFVAAFGAYRKARDSDAKH